MGNAIEVDGVSKLYRLGEARMAGTLRDALAGSATRLRRRQRDVERELWSLRDVTFDLPQGGALGIVGRNGAGKSTMLKILSRITEPTTGVARMKGRVASLLEVGTGFHPELTGRENVYLNGAILGMSRRDIAARYEAIVEFSGVGRFMATPVKRYSSGMYLRLAFAVAAHLEPDILVVDEILAVGDAEFQRKCIGRMSDVEAEGRTVIFVSHDLSAISRLCQRVIWLESGRVSDDGPTQSVLDAYLSSGAERLASRSLGGLSAGPVALNSVGTVDASGRMTHVMHRERPFTIEVDYTLRDRVPGFDLSVYAVTRQGIRVFDETWSDVADIRPDGPGRYVARVEVPPVLNVGEYTVGVWVGTQLEEILEEPVAHRFTLEGGVKGRPGRIVELLLPWSVEAVDDIQRDSTG